MSRTNAKPSVDSIKKQIHDLQVKLEKTQMAEYSKAEKALAKLQKQLASYVEKQKKAKARLGTARSKHKTKPTRATQLAVEKSIAANDSIVKATKEMKVELAAAKATLSTLKKDLPKKKASAKKVSVKKAPSKKK